MFQTNPRGVEARQSRGPGERRHGFQTNPRGVEAVGVLLDVDDLLAFQTNPRGVEAPFLVRIRWCRECFRRTLVGLKPTGAILLLDPRGVSDEPSWG